MSRDLLLYLDHTQQHVVDQIKKEHPEWVEADGACQPCTEYYRKQLKGELSDENIGPEGRRWRFVMGIVLLVFGVFLAFVFWQGDTSRASTLILFLPFFLGMLGLIQAREKTCALLAERGVRNMDAGEGKIANSEVAEALRLRGRMILAKSLVSAVLMTTLLYFFL